MGEVPTLMWLDFKNDNKTIEQSYCFINFNLLDIILNLHFRIQKVEKKKNPH